MITLKLLQTASKASYLMAPHVSTCLIRACQRESAFNLLLVPRATECNAASCQVPSVRVAVPFGRMLPSLESLSNCQRSSLSRQRQGASVPNTEGRCATRGWPALDDHQLLQIPRSPTATRGAPRAMALAWGPSTRDQGLQGGCRRLY